MPHAGDTTNAGIRHPVAVYLMMCQVSKLGLAINSLVFGGFQPVDVLADIRQFQDKKRRGNIDIWWLYDDGGMPVMLAHILKSR